MKFTREQSLYRQEPIGCDLSDGITMSPQFKIITGLCSISCFYPSRLDSVKSELDQSGSLWQEISEI